MAPPSTRTTTRTTTDREAVELFEQLAALTASGLPLPSGLRAAGDELGSRRLGSIFRSLADRVEAGETLPAALGSGHYSFPPQVRGLVLAGARSGRLAEVLAEYVRHANAARELRTRFWTSLAYPIVSLFVAVLLVGFISSLSARTYDALTIGHDRAIGREAGHVGALIRFARFIDEYGLRVVISLVGTLAVAGLSVRLVAPPAQRRRWACSIPVVGPPLRLTAASEFCHLLALLLDAGMPLPEAFELAGASVRDADLARAAARMGRSVAEGSPMATAAGLWPGIPAGLGQLFRHGEPGRGLAASLRIVGDMLEAQARAQSAFARNALGVFLLLMILWGVGFAVATLYLPLINAIRMLSGVI